MSTKLTQGPSVPPYLQPFVIEQHYDLYTPVDHAVWRHVMHHNTRFLEERAHPAYMRGFRQTGMDLDAVPNIRHMNECLEPFGWQAVTVDGFIPSAVFMDFQGQGFLPIAQDIRTADHIGYTPAPDIIHEAAGHAPLIVDPVFGPYLQAIGALGARAISNAEEHEVYEAIRELSIVKESPLATPAQIQAVELRLARAVEASTEVTEASLVSRLHWWTVEYGLIGPLDSPRIYGAGLLSSMSEGADCLGPAVRKLPFSLECLEYGFDITRPQPQLFVTPDFESLFEVIETFANRLAIRHGGGEGLRKALRSQRIATAVLSSGVQISGLLTALEVDEVGNPVFFATGGPSALAMEDVELPGHGLNRYPNGLGVVVGTLEGLPQGLEEASADRLTSLGLTPGAEVCLRLTSGVTIEGRLEKLELKDNRLILLHFISARARHQGRLLHAASPWVMPIGQRVTSVFAGSADRNRFVVERQRSDFVNVRQAVTPGQQALHALYAQVRQARGLDQPPEQLEQTLRGVALSLEAFPQDWLLRAEVLELAENRGILPAERGRILEHLVGLRGRDAALDRYLRLNRGIEG